MLNLCGQQSLHPANGGSQQAKWLVKSNVGSRVSCGEDIVILPVDLASMPGP